MYDPVAPLRVFFDKVRERGKEQEGWKAGRRKLA
jgi:hypothetical protein